MMSQGHVFSVSVDVPGIMEAKSMICWLALHASITACLKMASRVQLFVLARGFPPGWLGSMFGIRLRKSIIGAGLALTPLRD